MSEFVHDALRFNLENVPRLVTKEDIGNMHKTLGIMCLAHFAYRIYEWATTGTMFTNDTAPQVLFFVALHMALSGTSLLFHLPQNRVRSAPMLWPEGRMHSIIFAFRHLLCMVLMVTIPMQYNQYIRAALAIGTMLTADAATEYYKNLDNKLGTTMRGLPPPKTLSPTTMRCLNYYYSTCQILATVTTWYVPDLLSQFILVLPIQTAAFFLTLVRKGIMTTSGWHFAYTAALMTTGVITATCTGICRMDPLKHAMFWGTTVVFAVCRFGFHINKYLLWCTAIGVWFIVCRDLY